MRILEANDSQKLPILKMLNISRIFCFLINANIILCQFGSLNIYEY